MPQPSHSTIGTTTIPLIIVAIITTTATTTCIVSTTAGIAITPITMFILSLYTNCVTFTSNVTKCFYTVFQNHSTFKSTVYQMLNSFILQLTILKALQKQIFLKTRQFQTNSDMCGYSFLSLIYLSDV